MNKRFLMAILPLFLFTACASFSRKPAQVSEQGRNILILIHGIGGDSTTFGAMDLYFQKRGFEVYKFTYNTFSSDLTVDDFSKAYAKFLDEQFLDHPIQENDRISMVMHSQGGLIGLSWMIHSLEQQVGFSEVYLNQLTNFVTLSSPIWGAKMANFGEKVTHAYKITGKEMVGAAQLEQMSFGSENSYWLRQKLSDEKIQMQLKRLKMQVRFFNLAGWARNLKLLGLLTDGKGYESDTMVPLAAAREGFYYVRDFQQNYPEGYVTNESLMQKSVNHDYDIVEAFHSPLLLSAGIAKTPEECLAEICQHEPTVYVDQLLQGKNPTLHEKYFKEASAFFIEMRLHFPDEVKIDPASLKVKFSVHKSKIRSYLKRQSITLADPFEIMNHMYRPTAQRNQARVFFSGVASGFYLRPEERTSDLPYTENTIELEVTANGYKSRKVQVKVAPTFTTFIEVNFEPLNQ